MQKLFLSALIAVGTLMTADSASASLLTFVGVYGNAASKVYVGTAKINGKRGTYIVQRRNSDGACWTQYIAPESGLQQDWMIQLGAGNDLIQVLGPSNTITICGATLGGVPAYNGYYLDILGGAGDDALYAPVNFETFSFGEDGNDRIDAAWYAGVEVEGGNGNDMIYAAYNISFESIWGGAGNDYICEWDDERHAYRMDGGPGTDKRRGTANVISSIEGTTIDCPGDF